MVKLAESSGTVIYESENKLYLTKKPAQWATTLLFVTGLLAFILLANGILWLFVFNNQPHTTAILGTAFLALGILFAVAFWRLKKYSNKLNAKPVEELTCICIIDLAANTLQDGKKNILTSLDTVKLQRKMQITSSSPSLLLTWNNNTLTIVEGNPFSGGISAVKNALIAKGIKRN